MIKQFLSSAPFLFGIAVPIWVVIRIYVRRSRPVSWRREVWLAVFFTYMLMVAALTVMPERWATNREPRLNLVPFAGIREQMTGTGGPESTIFFLQNLIGNLGLLLPLGVILPVLWERRRSFLSVVLIAASVSIAIETIQFFLRFIGTSRMSDIDDVLLNTIGGAAGYFLFKAGKRFWSASYESKTVAIDQI